MGRQIYLLSTVLIVVLQLDQSLVEVRGSFFAKRFTLDSNENLQNSEYICYYCWPCRGAYANFLHQGISKVSYRSFITTRFPNTYLSAPITNGFIFRSLPLFPINTDTCCSNWKYWRSLRNYYHSNNRYIVPTISYSSAKGIFYRLLVTRILATKSLHLTQNIKTDDGWNVDKSPSFFGKSHDMLISFFHRVVATAGYMLPVLDLLQGFFGPLTVRFGNSINKNFFNLVNEILNIYSSIPMLPFALFSGSYYSVVKKNFFNFPYFVKYHIMQALILVMFQYAFSTIYFRLLSICGNSYGFELPIFHTASFTSILLDVFLLSYILSLFSIILESTIYASLAAYPEIPILSDAVKLHIGDDPEVDVKTNADGP